MCDYKSRRVTVSCHQPAQQENQRSTFFNLFPILSLDSYLPLGHRGKRINSLFAVDAIQKDAVIVYRGFHANYDELIAFEKEFGKVLDTTWAVNAPLDSQGRKGMIFGQIGTTDDPFACAHLLNAKLGANDVTANARFGVLDVAKARDIYPQIPSCIPDTARWPVVRISDAIPSRGELVLRTYGATYWHGKPSTCILKGLTPAEREWFEQQRK